MCHILHSHLILLVLITGVIFGEQYNHEAAHYALYFIRMNEGLSVRNAVELQKREKSLD
jgi:hypothetical protein